MTADRLKILFVASEVSPFSKTGGLADVAGALPAHLARRGHDVRVVSPLYDVVDRRRWSIRLVDDLQHRPLRLGPHTFFYSIAAAPHPRAPELDVWFADIPPLTSCGRIYGSGPDEAIRFAAFTRAAIEACQHARFAPDVVHLNDWHTALAPLWLETRYAWDELFAATRTVLTIHNLGYQGVFPRAVLRQLDLEGEAHLLWREHLDRGVVNFLATGIQYADLITTVSRTYAREIQTPEHGCGLHEMLRARADHLVGIVNGIDAETWNPETDPHIPRRYGPGDWEGKAACRAALLAECGLEADPRDPVFASISRLTPQKGIALLLDVIPALVSRRDARFVALGSGERDLEERLAALAAAYPRRVHFRRGYDEPFAHRIEAGADAFLMPSRYEPCGLNQLYSLRYGTVPIVRHTGGLADTVVPWMPGRDDATGFAFRPFTPSALAAAIEEALAVWSDRSAWRRMMRRGMAVDMSWDRQSGIYEEMYRRLTGGGTSAERAPAPPRTR